MTEGKDGAATADVLRKNIGWQVENPDEVLLDSLMNDRLCPMIGKWVVLSGLWVFHHPMTAFASNLVNGKKRIMLS